MDRPMLFLLAILLAPFAGTFAEAQTETSHSFLACGQKTYIVDSQRQKDMDVPSCHPRWLRSR